ncbi:MAG: hypothetical protein R3D55_19810 [Chloroflexota bacterium]
MEIWHRVGLNAIKDIKFKNAIEKIGIEYQTLPLPGHDIGLLYFDISESDSNWPHISDLIKIYKASDVCDTIHDVEEILSASWCRLIPEIEQGSISPQQHHLAWKKQVYKDVCGECGAYGNQIKPFTINKNLRPGKNAFLSLTGTYTILGTNKVFEVLIENSIQGLESWELTLDQSDKPIQNMKQIYIPHESESKIISGNWKSKICPNCGIRKFLPHRRGYLEFENQLLNSRFDILRTREWFGDGKAAYQEILVSSKFSRQIVKNRWKGVRLKPVILD